MLGHHIFMYRVEKIRGQKKTCFFDSSGSNNAVLFKRLVCDIFLLGPHFLVLGEGSLPSNFKCSSEGRKGQSSFRDHMT